MSCLFCEIVKGNIPSEKVYEDDYILAFKDISPMAPVHIIIIPKIHINSANEINNENSNIISKIFAQIPEIAKNFEITDGYRIITNIGEDGGQTIRHLHFHLLGGKKLNTNLA